ncbi:MAG: Y-family DNA polymerase, partial [Albidovulum sp.]
MPVAEARAALPATMATAPGACVVAEATPAADAGALRALALWAQRFSPWVSVDGEDGLLLDATGCEGVFGSERAMARAVLAGLRRLRIEARVAAAGTIGAAWAGARFGAAEREPVVIESGEARIEAALAGLPVAALRLEAETIAGLSEIGITRVGEVLALPRAVLPARFGGVVLRRVDQALGRVAEVLDPVREEAPIEASIVFDGPTTNVEAVSRAVREVVEAEWGVCAQLRAKERGARVLRVELARADLSPAVLEVVLSRPGRDG